MIKNQMQIVGGFFMAKNKVARKENSTPVYSENDIAERTSQGRRVVVEHVKD